MLHAQRGGAEGPVGAGGQGKRGVCGQERPLPNGRILPKSLRVRPGTGYLPRHRFRLFPRNAGGEMQRPPCGFHAAAVPGPPKIIEIISPAEGRLHRSERLAVPGPRALRRNIPFVRNAKQGAGAERPLQGDVRPGLLQPGRLAQAPRHADAGKKVQFVADAAEQAVHPIVAEPEPVPHNDRPLQPIRNLRIQKAHEPACAPFGRKRLVQRQVGGAQVGERVQFAGRHGHQRLPVSKSRVAPGRGYRGKLFRGNVDAVRGQYRPPPKPHDARLLRPDRSAERPLHIQIDRRPEPAARLPKVLRVPDAPAGRGVGKNHVPRREKPGFQQDERFVQDGNLPDKGSLLFADRRDVQVVDRPVAQRALRGHPEYVMLQRVGVGGADHSLSLNGHEILVQVRHVVRRGQGEFFAPCPGLAHGAYRRARGGLLPVSIRPQQVERGIAEMDDAVAARKRHAGLPRHGKRSNLREHALLAANHLFHQTVCESLARHQGFFQRNHDGREADHERFRLVRGHGQCERGVSEVLDDDGIGQRGQFQRKPPLRIRNGAVGHVLREHMRAGQQGAGCFVRHRPPDARLPGGGPGSEGERKDIEEISEHGGQGKGFRPGGPPRKPDGGQSASDAPGAMVLTAYRKIR